jgi:hypothetical protein
MKTLKQLIISALLFIMMSCTEKSDTYYTINMQKVTGEWITKTYLLPYNTSFYITSDRGSYYLCYIEITPYFFNKVEIIRAGIVDYKVTKLIKQ